MASLALLASIILLFIILVGPITYLLARIGFPNLIVWILAIISIFSGLWISIILPHIFYIGLIPIYFGYISIQRTNKYDKN